MFDEKQYQDNVDEAYRRFNAGDEAYCFSTNMADEITAGYGVLDYFGEFEYPLLVDQETFKIIGGNK